MNFEIIQTEQDVVAIESAMNELGQLGFIAALSMTSCSDPIILMYQNAPDVVYTYLVLKVLNRTDSIQNALSQFGEQGYKIATTVSDCSSIILILYKEVIPSDSE